MANLVQKVDTSQIVVTFRLSRTFGIRMWFVVQLLKLADLIAPVIINYEIDTPPPDPFI